MAREVGDAVAPLIGAPAGTVSMCENVTAAQFSELMSVDVGTWKEELTSHGELFEQLKSRLPRQLVLKRELFQMSAWR